MRGLSAENLGNKLFSHNYCKPLVSILYKFVRRALLTQVIIRLHSSVNQGKTRFESKLRAREVKSLGEE